jgi:Protein of unknown function (DUF3352)
MLAFNPMKLGDWITRRNILIASIVLAICLIVAVYFALKRPPRVQMDRYVPASALAFIEFDNLASLADGFVGTKAWREMAPALGLSNRIKLGSQMAALMGRLGIGSDEAVLAGRAQFAIALTGIGGSAEQSEEGAALHIKPHIALIVETHTSERAAERVAREWGERFARRIYGDATSGTTEDYQGSRLAIFHGREPGRQLVAATYESRIVIANNADAAKSCLDAMAGRAPALSGDATLKQMRPQIDQGAAVFGFVTESGLEQLATLLPALIASRAPVNSEGLEAITSLLDHVSKQATGGLLYAARFAPGGVIEKYLTALRPQVAEGLAVPMKPAPAATFESLRLVPREAASLTIWSVERVGDLPERVLKRLAPRVDVVAELAIRQFVINFRRQYGLEPADSIGDFVGDEVALVGFGDESPTAMLVRAKNKEALFPVVSRYLKRGGARVSTEQYKDFEIASSSEDGRAAAFVGDFLTLATREQIIKIADALASGNSIATDERFEQAVKSRPATAAIFSYRPQATESGELMLAISKLARVTDGSRQLLDSDSAREAMSRLPPSVSFTEFRDYGIYTETRSAVGSFHILGKLIAGSD